MTHAPEVQPTNPTLRRYQGPLFVQAVLVEILRKRFAPTNQAPVDPAYPAGAPAWVYDEQNPANNTIFIQVQYGEADETGQATPALCVTTGSLTHVDMGVLGDRSPHGGPAWVQGTHVKRHLVGLEAGVVAIGVTRSESEMLGLIVFELVLCLKNEIARAFLFHEVSSPTMSQSYPSPTHMGCYETRVATRVLWERDLIVSPYPRWDVSRVLLDVQGRMGDGGQQVSGGTQSTVIVRGR